MMQHHMKMRCRFTKKAREAETQVARLEGDRLRLSMIEKEDAEMLADLRAALDVKEAECFDLGAELSAVSE